MANISLEVDGLHPKFFELLRAFAEGMYLSDEQKSRLGQLHTEIVSLQIESIKLANEEQELKNRRAQIEIDGIKIQHLLMVLRELFPDASDPMRIAITAKMYPDLQFLAPANAIFVIEPDTKNQ